MAKAQDGAMVVSYTHRQHLPQEIHLIPIAVRGCVELRVIVRLGSIFL